MNITTKFQLNRFSFGWVIQKIKPPVTYQTPCTIFWDFTYLYFNFKLAEKHYFIMIMHGSIALH